MNLSPWRIFGSCFVLGTLFPHDCLWSYDIMAVQKCVYYYYYSPTRWTTSSVLVTSSIIKAQCHYFSYSGGDFEVFHLRGVTCCTNEGEICHEVAKFLTHRGRSGAPKQKFLRKFRTQMPCQVKRSRSQIKGQSHRIKNVLQLWKHIVRWRICGCLCQCDLEWGPSSLLWLRAVLAD